METKHTRLYANGQYVTDKVSFGYDADGARIGETPNIAMDAGTPELARLIAAAPETAAERDRLKEEKAALLEALHAASATMPFIRGDLIYPAYKEDRYQETLSMIGAAIAKAEGL